MEVVGQLAGGIAHDFNNILGIITGYAELTLEDHSLGNRARHRVNEIKEAARRAADVTRQLLALSRKQLLQKRILDLNAVIHDTMNMLQRLVGENIEFATRLEPDLGAVEADPTSMDQVLMNLVVNARDAMPDGGILTIETANVPRNDTYKAQHPDLPAGNYVALIVSDTGIGIDPDIRKSIFEPFFTTKQLGSGTGLGLSTVYGIVKQSGGFLYVDSELGQGAKFTIYLPQIRAVVTAAQRPGTESEPRGSETVLLVEDDEKLRQLNAELLLGLGYNVIEGGNAAEAIAAAQGYSGPLDLLMTDVVMPGMNGYKLAGLLSEVRPELRVLFVSGYADTTVAQQLADSDAAFLQKPFAFKTLAAKLREVLDAPTRPVG
jgi:two-component system, cell cycle sensor histidine kinase and response regulator CckA